MVLHNTTEGDGTKVAVPLYLIIQQVNDKEKK